PEMPRLERTEGLRDERVPAGAILRPEPGRSRIEVRVGALDEARPALLERGTGTVARGAGSVLLDAGEGKQLGGAPLGAEEQPGKGGPGGGEGLAAPMERGRGIEGEATEPGCRGTNRRLLDLHLGAGHCVEEISGARGADRGGHSRSGPAPPTVGPGERPW